jgi:hypothetical protein
MGELKKVSARDFRLTCKRDYAEEVRRAQISLFSGVESLLRDKESGADIAVWQVALCLILCGLPYEETAERKVTRRARLADGSWLIVQFTAMGYKDELDEEGNPKVDPETGKIREICIPLPFGADRGPLHFLINKAILRSKELQRLGVDSNSEEARFVPWETASEYLTEMRLAPGGKNRRDLRSRIERIKHCAITVTRISGNDEEVLMVPVFSKSRLPRSVDTKAKQREQGSQGNLRGVVFNQEFFQEVTRYHMPVPVQLLRATMGRSQIQDYVLWLHWRAFAAKEATVIPWLAVRQQLWQNDSNEARLAAVMRRAIATLRAVWPELTAEVNPKIDGKRFAGLLIGPPRGGVYMFAGVEGAQKKLAIISPAKRA